MGAALSVSNATAINKINTETVQIAENSCTATCQNLISGISVILVGSTTGNITFDQSCEADASCMMSNALEQAVEAYQLAEAKADAQLPILPIGFQAAFANALTTNDVNASMKQVLENHCNANVDNTIQDVLIFATNSKTGDIAFTQSGNASARCVMDNAGKMKLSIRQTGKASATSGSVFGGLIGLIIIVIVIIMITTAIKKKTGGQCPDGQPPGQNGQCPPPGANRNATQQGGTSQPFMRSFGSRSSSGGSRPRSTTIRK
jgi:hypothetical protein